MSVAEPALTDARVRLLTPRFMLVVTCGLFYFLALAMLTPVIPHYVKDSLHDNGVAVGAAVGAFAVGAISSGITGWFAVWLTLRIVRNHPFLPFVIYRIALGSSILVALALGFRS